MKIHYDRTGAQRKEIVKVISKVTGEKAKYLGMPSCAYQIGPFHLDKEGILEFDETGDNEIPKKVVDGLLEAGFARGKDENIGKVLEQLDGADSPQEAHSEEKEEDAMELTISIPYEGFDENSLQNLDNLVKAKGSLIKKALGVDELPIKVQGEEIKFPWFKTTLDNDLVIYGAAESEDWTSPEVWKKANPSLGETITIDKVVAACESAKQNPAEENSFRQLRLNQWVNQAVRWMPMDKCAFTVNEDELEGRVCYGGLDLSSTTDITAFVLVFPPLDDEDKYYVLPYFWILEDNVDLRVRRDHVPYDVWEKQGTFLTTEGMWSITATLSSLSRS